MKISQIGLGVLAITTTLTACKDVEFKKTKGGVPYKIFSSGKSKDSIVTGNVVKYQTIMKVQTGKKDSVINNSYQGFPVFQEIGPATDSYFDPAMEVFRQAKKGDSIYFVQVMDSFIARNPGIEQNTPFRKGDRLITTIRIQEVYKSGEEARVAYEKEIKDFEANEGKTIENFLAKNNIKAEKTSGGVFVQTLSPGSGPKPDSGQFVVINFRGTHLNGEEFDSGVFPMQIGTGRAIAGFEEAVKNMNKGQKVKAFVPSMLAYGPRGSQPKIKPFESLIFEMELVEISDTPPAGSEQPVDPRQRH
jgi:FKBP-type peptidyl-prolyl cis-trans isomerase